MPGELLSKAHRNMCHSKSVGSTTAWRNMNYLMQTGDQILQEYKKHSEAARKKTALKDINEGKIDIMIKY